MPYAKTSELPSAVKKLPAAAQKFFLETFNKVYKGKDSEGTAFAIAWKATKNRLKHSKGKYVALSQDFNPVSIVTFDLNMQPSSIITNADTNEIILEAPLVNMEKNSNGLFLTEVELEDIAKQINAFGSTFPDIEHGILEKLIRQYGHNPDAIREALKREKGITNAVRAVVDKGQLWVQMHLDKKKYLENTSKYNKLSIELFADTDIVTGRMTNPNYLGLTLTQKPSIKNIAPVIIRA